MNKYKKYIWLFFLFGFLILIRAFENFLFYDPYLKFFHNDYLYIDSPRREVLKLTLSTTMRYVINTLISLAVLYVFFKDWSIIKFSVIIYSISYLILILLFLYFVMNPRQEDYYIFFNIRRFLIQPLLLLLLLPAFYYQRKGL
ncbi:exosortase F-associated protein [Lacinutrix venerupis]|uniref:Exosortase F system-associated protein n=1 Tax=Lacinutrix venerupis TaxID=1486034 RepID=A0AAC9PWS1_9FLAO|nr:exosortase F system-associated protein [Lacinutrix venerupis]APY01147.1 exosortase F system-associated protein [Lacinutrix venerupis]RLJ67309.1 exosortase F-associated protein [Lacinutrix venerupis]